MRNTFEYVINERLSINSFDIPINHKDTLVLLDSIYKIIKGKISSTWISISTGYDIHIDKNISPFDGTGFNLSIHNRLDKLYELKSIPAAELDRITKAIRLYSKY